MSCHDHPVDPERVEAVRAGGLTATEAEQFARLARVLADPLRGRILAALLVSDEMCVGDLALALDANEDAVSYALRRLRTAGLVLRRRDGRMGYYRLRDGAARAIAGVVNRLRELSEVGSESSTGDRADA